MSPLRRIVVVTGTRAEYGLLEPVMRALQHRARLSVVVSGMHLVTGTWRDIAWNIDARVPMQKRGSVGREADVDALGRGVRGFGRVFGQWQPDIVVVLGDRIEAFAAASAASVGGMRLAHLHGGDRAQGVADESLRHATSKLAHLHLPATAQSARRLVRMGEQKRWVFHVGSPAVSGLADIKPLEDAAFGAWQIDPHQPFIVVMQHPCGATDAKERQWMAATLRATSHMQRLVMGPNGDPGRAGTMAAIRDAGIDPIDHLPRRQFIGLLKRASVLVGNSSAGLIEAAAMRVATVNVGRRQWGREKPGNVIDVAPTVAAVRAGLRRALARKVMRYRQPYGDGHAHERIAGVLCGVDLREVSLCKRNAY